MIYIYTSNLFQFDRIKTKCPLTFLYRHLTQLKNNNDKLFFDLATTSQGDIYFGGKEQSIERTADTYGKKE